MSRSKNTVVEKADGYRLEVYTSDDRGYKEYFQEITLYSYLRAFDGFDVRLNGVGSFGKFCKEHPGLLERVKTLVTVDACVVGVTLKNVEVIFNGEFVVDKEFRAWVTVRAYFNKPSEFLEHVAWKGLINRDGFLALTKEVLAEYEIYYNTFSWKSLVAKQVNELVPWVEETINEMTKKSISYSERVEAFNAEYALEFKKLLDKMLALGELEKEVAIAEGNEPTAWDKHTFAEVRKRRERLLRDKPPGQFRGIAKQVQPEEIEYVEHKD